MKTLSPIFLLLLCCASAFAADRILLVTGVEHPGHPWQETAPILQNLLAKAGFDVTRTDDYTSVADTDLSPYKAVILHFLNPKASEKDGAVLNNLEQYVQNGGGVIVTHFAIGAFNMCDQYKRIIGRVWNPEMRPHDPYGEFEMKAVPMDAPHSIADKMPVAKVKDELYTCTDGDSQYEVVAAAVSKVDSMAYPLVYIYRPGKGRAVAILLGHNTESVGNAEYGKWFVRCAQFAAGQIPDSQADSQRNELSQKQMKSMAPSVTEKDLPRIEALKTNAPSGERLVGYMNCGAYKISDFGSVEISVENGANTWNFLTATPKIESENGVKIADVTATPEIDAIVFYKKDVLTFTLKGIEKSKKYRLFVKWWDFDSSSRSQGIYCMSPDKRLIRRSLDPVALPNFTQMGAGAAVKSILLPASYSRNGELKIAIPAPGCVNAVVSEMWLYEIQ